MPFRFPQLLAVNGRTIHIVEGEKDVLALESLGLVVTCNPGGAGKWRAEFGQFFQSANVIVFPDNDEAGERHAQEVANKLRPVAASLRIVRLPGLPPKGDVSDWIARGGTADELARLCGRSTEKTDPVLAGPDAKIQLLPPELSEDAIAMRFAERHEHDLRYVAVWKQWLKFDGQRWSVENTLRAFDYARAICRDAAARCFNPKVASIIASARTVAAVERLAKSDRRLAATTMQWDSDAWLLNTPTGTIDLRTGECRPHLASDYITTITGAGLGGDCPLWRAFLDKITGRDEELQGFLQRVVGYSLTGVTCEHALFFLYGTGANGKSVFINTIAGMLGDHHRTAPIETFTASSIDRHPTELAGLRGARLVTSIETEEGRGWAESRIKALTGGDKIAARFMKQDFFEFVPQFKLLIAGNHKPGLRSVDEAIRRRFHLVPFTVTVPPAERDQTLTERLKSECAGILAWALEGCMDWQQRGLCPPKAVVDATAAYLESEDTLMAWIAERCTSDTNAWERSSELFADWKAWAARGGEPAGTQKRFSQNLEARGFTLRKRSHGNGFEGLHLVPRMTGGPLMSRVWRMWRDSCIFPLARARAQARVTLIMNSPSTSSTPEPPATGSQRSVAS